MSLVPTEPRAAGQDPRRSVLVSVANRYGMEPAAFEQTLRATVVPNNTSREQFAACLVVANEYRLNPLTKEIYFFPARGGGVVPIVGVDGWCRIINEHPAFDGVEFDTQFLHDKVFSVTCRMFRKDRQRPIAITEYYSECSRPTDPWKGAPARMLRHKAMIQAARYAFGFSGIYDEDEAERIVAEGARDVTPRQGRTPPIPPTIAQHDQPIDVDLKGNTDTPAEVNPAQQQPKPVQEAGKKTPPKQAESTAEAPAPAKKAPPVPPANKAKAPPAQEPPVDESMDWQAEIEAFDNACGSAETAEEIEGAKEAQEHLFNMKTPKAVAEQVDRIVAAELERIERQG